MEEEFGNKSIEELLIEEKKLNQQMGALNKEAGRIVHDKEFIAKQISKIHSKIKRKQAGDILVSDHAIVRYLERIKKVDIESIKKEILTDEIKDKIKNGPGYGFLVVGEYELVLKDYIIVSILDTTPAEGWGLLLDIKPKVKHYFKEDNESLCGNHKKEINFRLEPRMGNPKDGDCNECAKILRNDAERIFKIRNIS